MQECADALGISVEGYRLKEVGQSPTSTAELVKLAKMYGEPLRTLFPSWAPAEEDKLVADAVRGAA